MTIRTMKRLHLAVREDIGDLITQRPLPNPIIAQIDPFLFLNHHGPQTCPPHNQGLPFGPHPHRGFETVTMILAGMLAHHDSAGFENVIQAGGVQWMTAGSGIVHAEISPEQFKRDGGPIEILQLWVNLPRPLKMTPPRYVGVQRDQIPAIELNEGLATLHLIAGEWNGTVGPIRSITNVFLSTVELKSGARLRIGNLYGRGILLYVIRGMIDIDGDKAGALHLAELNEEGEELYMTAEMDSLIVLAHAEPINEPVVAYGPFVMNSWEEITQAIEDYRAGRFGAPP